MIATEISSTLTGAGTLLRLAKEMKPRPLSTRDCFSARLEATAQQYANHTAVTFEGQTRTWQELNNHANQYVAALQNLGLKRGDVVSVMLENRIEFLTTIIALNKLGITGALVNTNLTGRSFVHCLTITNAKVCLFGEERLATIEEVRDDPALANIENFLFVPDAGDTPCPEWALDLENAANNKSCDNPPETQEMTLGDIAFYIFTSGTTGFPKASVLSNRRYLAACALSAKGGLKCDINDCIYLCLPLYHGTGLFFGVGAAIYTGASMFIRRKFSASNFLPEVREHGATCFIYIGEMCRYLLNTPKQEDDYKSPLCNMMGNGLRPDVWHEFKNRFGIARVAEFYGSSEGNIGFVNLLNKDCTVGITTIPLALVKYDVDADEILLDKKGFCIKAEKGEPGLLLGKITKNTAFEGYTDTQETEKKILRGAFKKEDAWFNTGDLLKRVDVGFAMGLPHYQFVDRVGDTFRWKSENVSTNEVGEIINGHPQVAICNVYGVEVFKADGRAGMAAIVLTDGTAELDTESLSAHIAEQLPSYARPVFLRVQPELDTTGTFKMVKGDLRKQGYDPALVSDTLYILKPGNTVYEVLTPDYVELIRTGQAGY